MTTRNRAYTAGVSTVLAAVVGMSFTVGPFAASAEAGARNPGYMLRKVALPSGKKAVVRWDPCQATITYRVNLDGVPKKRRAAMLRQVRTGVATLSAADGMTYTYKGRTSFVPRKGNIDDAPAELVVAVVKKKATNLSMPKGVLGVGGPLWQTWSDSSGEGAAAVRGFVLLSSTDMGRLKQGFGAGKTVGNVLLHELGHATGLEHSTVRSSLMYPELTRDAPDGFAAGDLAGLKRVGRAAGCITVPHSDDLPDLS